MFLLALTTAPVRTADLVSVIVRDVSVLDPTGSHWLTHRDIVITDTTITAVRPSGAALPPAKTTIYGAGKFAIPGLFDNRAALSRFTRDTAALFVAVGVTSVRDTGSDPSQIAEWRRDIAYGKFMGPRIVGVCASASGDCAARADALPQAPHEDMARLVREGRKPAAALRAATLESAQLNGRAKDLGSIEPGKIADVLILTGDPLTDIRHTAAIDAVIFRGEALTRAHLNMLVARAAGAKR